MGDVFGLGAGKVGVLVHEDHAGRGAAERERVARGAADHPCADDSDLHVRLPLTAGSSGKGALRGHAAAGRGISGARPGP